MKWFKDFIKGTGQPKPKPEKKDIFSVKKAVENKRAWKNRIDEEVKKATGG